MPCMSTLRAVVRKGYLVLCEPTDLPEGTVVELIEEDPYAHLNNQDNLDEEERIALHASIERGLEQMKRGDGRSADEFLAELVRHE